MFLSIRTALYYKINSAIVCKNLSKKLNTVINSKQFIITIIAVKYQNVLTENI